MENAIKFREKLRRGQVCFAAHISCTDPTITEALCSVADVVWVDMEHNALSLETVQAHFMATKGSDTAVLVRVPWNDPVLIKPVLDIGADGIIVPMVRTVDEVRRAVAACRYPPDGIRGFGPRRASGFGRLGGPDYCRLANESIIVVVQIEHIDAVNNLDEILAVPGLTSIADRPATTWPAHGPDGPARPIPMWRPPWSGVAKDAPGRRAGVHRAGQRPGPCWPRWVRARRAVDHARRRHQLHAAGRQPMPANCASNCAQPPRREAK